jgi:hypothetical protein
MLLGRSTRPGTPESAASSIADEGFFVLRTPLFPFEELVDWASGAVAAGTSVSGDHTAWEADTELLRGRLAALLARPLVRRAILLASPTLAAAIPAWQAHPSSKRGLRAERALGAC